MKVEKIPYLLPCPFCGHDLNSQDPMDTIYPVGRNSSLLELVCQQHAGGCDASVLGTTREEVITKWNSRVRA